MNTKHTPGPWVVASVGSYRWIHPAAWRQVQNQRNDICRLTPHDYYPLFDYAESAAKEEAEANARLIAAAPELLSALQGLVAELERTSYYSIPEHHPSKAAIRAATGGAA